MQDFSLRFLGTGISCRFLFTPPIRAAEGFRWSNHVFINLSEQGYGNANHSHCKKCNELKMQQAYTMLPVRFTICAMKNAHYSTNARNYESSIQCSRSHKTVDVLSSCCGLLRVAASGPLHRRFAAYACSMYRTTNTVHTETCRCPTNGLCCEHR